MLQTLSVQLLESMRGTRGMKGVILHALCQALPCDAHFHLTSPRKTRVLANCYEFLGFHRMKVDVPYPLFFSIRLALWTRDRAEVRAGPSISMTRSKHSVFIKQTKLDVANPFSFSSVQLLESMRGTRGMKRVILHTIC